MNTDKKKDCSLFLRIGVHRWFILGLLTVAIRITRDRALDSVVHALPGVLGRELCMFPAQARAASIPVPVTGQIGFDIFERPALVLAVRGIAVAIRRGVGVVFRARLHVVAFTIVFAPVGVFLGGVDGLGHAFAGQATCDRADDGA